MSVVTETIEIAISKIVVGERKRQLGEVSNLMTSIEQVGLIYPLTVTRKGKRLVAGLHRLEALRALGWKKIPMSID